MQRQHSSPLYRSRLQCTAPSSPRYAGQAYLTDPARDTTGQTNPSYAMSAIQPSVQAPVRQLQLFHSQVCHFARKAESILDQVRTTRIDAKGLTSLHLQLFVRQAASPILQVSRTYDRPIARRQSSCGRYRTGETPRHGVVV